MAPASHTVTATSAGQLTFRSFQTDSISLSLFTMARCAPQSPRIGGFPGADSSTPLVEQSLVVALANLQARVGREQAPDRRPQVEDGEVRLGTGRRDGVG